MVSLLLRLTQNNLFIPDENYFSGSIPNEIGNLDKMELLNFCKLNSFILLKMILISTIYLINLLLLPSSIIIKDNNRLVGTVPDGVGNLNKLKELVMGKQEMEP